MTMERQKINRLFLHLVFIVAVTVIFDSSVNGDLTITAFMTTCLGNQMELPNLSFAKRVVTIPSTNCTEVMDPFVPVMSTVTWYYYENFPQTCGDDQCCHNTTTSTLTATLNLITSLGGSVTGKSTGTVTAGAFCGKAFTQTSVYPVPNPALCSSAMGMEARSGTFTLAIVGGPTCTGIVYHEYCPGTH